MFARPETRGGRRKASLLFFLALGVFLSGVCADSWGAENAIISQQGGPDDMQRVLAHIQTDQGVFSAEWPAAGVRSADGMATIGVEESQARLKPCGQAVRRSVQDVLGAAEETTLPMTAEGLPVSVTLKVRTYLERPLIGVQAEALNAGAQPCRLGDLELVSKLGLSLGDVGSGLRAYVSELAHPTTSVLVPCADPQKPIDLESHGMATLGGAIPRAFTMGFVDAPTHRPVVRVSFVPATGELSLSGIARFNGRRLEPGQRVETGRLVLYADSTPLGALETYGDLLARVTPPRKTTPTIGWCSWYAIRLPISHAFTMANARVVAEHFRGLGMDVMLLDHGWQAGDICGDWDVDQADYPGGLEALAKDLQGLGLKLGIWIAPTEVAQTSRLFIEHPDWMLRDASGKPAPTWKWYWAPNPQQYQLDATHPGAYEYVANTFRKLTQAGASYYKIDFIAGCSGENLYPADPGQVRGWDPLRRAMQAVREGAGDAAYVRFCQTPPLLSTGVADGVFATTDTLDAGASTWPTLLEVFRTSSAQFWQHGRVYNHDACDMSVRAQAGTEECRLRAVMLALSGSSIMFSDDMTILPEERIRLMQQCMPGFDKAARPLNLFTSDTPDIWRLHIEHAGLEWELLALFNFSTEQRQVEVAWQDMGLKPDAGYLLREFWTGAFAGPCRGKVSLAVPAQAVRLYALWPDLGRPQFVGTDLHLSQGLAELSSIEWDEKQGLLRGVVKRAEGIRGTLYFRLPTPWTAASGSGPLRHVCNGLWAMDVRFDNAEEPWSLDTPQG